MDPNPKSRGAQFYERALRVMPGGVSRNTVLRKPHPLYAASGHGCRVVDVDGVERIDFANNMAALIHGHAFGPVVEAVEQQLRRGTAFTMATEVELEFAEFLCERVPSFEKIRFVNSGTEAVMSCLKAARAFTGRPKVAKVEGAYHGLYDYAEVSQTSNPSNWGAADGPASNPVSIGTPQGALDDVVVIPFNDAATARSILDRHAGEIACVLVDPMPHKIGLMRAETEFLGMLRDWTLSDGALLVFDEVITFRSTLTGAQGWYDVRPDLTAMGKLIGGGFPVGALAGRADVMDVMDPTRGPSRFPHSGTFSANPITMIAGLTAMRHFDAAAVDRLNALGDRARKQIADAIAIADTPASVTGDGSLLRIHMKATPPRDHRSCYPTPAESEALERMLRYQEDHGILGVYSGSAILSTAMTEHEIDVFSEVVLGALRTIREFRASTTSQPTA